MTLTSTSTPHRNHRPWGKLRSLGLYILLLFVLAVLNTTTSDVIAHATTVLTTTLWLSGWLTIAGTLVGLLYWVARTSGLGVRDGLGIAPRWAGSSRRLVRLEDGLNSNITAAVFFGVFLLVLAPGLTSGPPMEQGAITAVLTTHIVMAMATELVLVGAVFLLVRAAGLPSWDFVLFSAIARLTLAESGWVSFLATVVAGVVVAVVYLRTRRLTPIIIAHATAAAAVSLTGAWISSLV